MTLEQEIAVEQRHLDRVYARLARLREETAANQRDGYRIAQLGHVGALEERDAMVYHFARRLARLDAEHEGLVFGRLDRRDGSTQYVGRIGIRDADTTPLLIDWRAPAAADFYQATAADPRGVVRRRSIRSRGETVVGLDDDLLDPSATLPVVGDGALLAAISRISATPTGRGMRAIVATIQKEQDQAIRSPARGVTVVEGGPGTGKTAVALHRVAYLLYQDRARYDAGGGILVVGPSPVFMGYIGTVLPALGEHTATLRALGELVDGVRASRVDPAPLAALKGSLRMATLLRRLVREQVPGAPTELRLAWHGTLLRLDESTLERVRRRALSGKARRNQVRRVAFDGIFDALWADAGAPPGIPREAFEDELAGRADFRNFLRAWWPRLRPQQVLAWLADPQLLARIAEGILSEDEVKALAAAFAEDGHSVADVALLDELDHLLGRPPQPARRRRNPYQVAPGVYEMTTFAEREARAAPEPPPGIPEYPHIVVDEAQDVSPMQWRALGRRGRFASWTVVGDPAQSAWSGDPAELARARDAALRGGGARRQRTHTYQLTTNYRNSVEIFELAASVIRQVAPDASLPVAVRATGIPPEDRLVTRDELPEAVRAAVAGLLAQVEGTVGVIALERLTDWLDPHDRVQVVTALEAKGLEYDGVLLVEPHRLAVALGLRTLYVALSRATQRLVTIGTTRWP